MNTICYIHLSLSNTFFWLVLVFWSQHLKYNFFPPTEMLFDWLEKYSIFAHLWNVNVFSAFRNWMCFFRIKQQLMVAQLFIIANFHIKESKPLIIINYVINLHSFQLNIKYTNWKYQFLMDFHDFKQQLYVTVAWFNYVHICNLCQTGKTLQTSLQAPAV